MPPQCGYENSNLHPTAGGGLGNCCTLPHFWRISLALWMESYFKVYLWFVNCKHVGCCLVSSFVVCFQWPNSPSPFITGKLHSLWRRKNSDNRCTSRRKRHSGGLHWLYNCPTSGRWRLKSRLTDRAGNPSGHPLFCPRKTQQWANTKRRNGSMGKKF